MTIAQEDHSAKGIHFKCYVAVAAQVRLSPSTVISIQHPSIEQRNAPIIIVDIAGCPQSGKSQTWAFAIVASKN